MHPAFLKTALILGVIAGLAASAFAAEEKSAVKEEAKAADEKVPAKKSETAGPETADVIRTTTDQITGQVSGIDKSYIGVIYQKPDGTENEMGIIIEGTPQLERVKDLKQIQMGDMVNVEYAVVTEKGDGDEEINRKVARKITFVKPAPPPPPETTVLTSEEGGQ